MPSLSNSPRAVIRKPAVRPQQQGQQQMQQQAQKEAPLAGAGGAGGAVGGGVSPASAIRQPMAGGANPPQLGFGRGGMSGGGFQFRPPDPSAISGPGAGANIGNIQGAIQSMKGQLGMPGGAGPGAALPSVGPESTGGMLSKDTGAGAGIVGPKLPWQQLQELGVGGQGSPMANRAKLTELLAARGIGGGTSMPGAPGASGALGMPPGSQPGKGQVAGGGAGMSEQQMPGMIPNEAGGVPIGQDANPYLDIMRMRGVGGYGGPGAAGGGMAGGRGYAY